MMRTSCLIQALLLLIAAPTLTAAGGGAAPRAGDILPVIELAVPRDDDQRRYLGLQAAERFRVGDIQSEVVILQVFSMYCPHCQREAPDVNRLFEAIEADRRYRGRVKLIGIGAGNSAFEVGVFQKSFSIPFPLFADEDFTIHQQLGAVRTPYFFGARIGEDGALRVFYSRLGGINGAAPDLFLKTLLTNAGLH
ncbi:MAG: TlpA disulfide reductase family protein [Desulfobacterales bacterium]